MSDESDYSDLEEEEVGFVDPEEEEEDELLNGFGTESQSRDYLMDEHSNMSTTSNITGPDGDKNADENTKFQKELWQLKHLPYYKELQRDADTQWQGVKFGLAQAILNRDVRPALLHWACELDKYMLLYGRRFTKAEHIWLVRLFYQMLTMKDLEYRMVKTFAMLLGSLIDKRELLTQDDITLDWRPLYDIYCVVQFKNLEDDGTFLLPEGLEAQLESLIMKARVYFPPTATQEILDEVRPYICPWDTSMVRAITCLNLFLPTIMPASIQLTHGFGLWYEELWYWFENIQNTPPWEAKIWGLLGRLARDCCGQIDWSPHYEVLFTRILRYLGLMVGSTGKQMVPIGPGSGTGKVHEVEAATVLVVYLLGGENGAQAFVGQLFRALESFFHPSNFGKWTDKLLNFLFRLSLALCQRLHKERHKKPDWQPQIPDKHRLTDEQVDAFVSSVLPCALQGMFTKYRQDLAIGAIRYLSQLAPKLVVPAVLERLYPALETLTEPHRLLNSMTCLVAVALALTRDRPIIDEEEEWPNAAKLALRSSGDSEKSRSRASKDGKNRKAMRARKSVEDERKTVVDSINGSYRKHVFSLLNAMLPGLDPNDIGKSMITFQAMSLFCALIPMVDCSEASQLRDDLTEEEKELCSATATLEDFVTRLMDRMFLLIETTAHNASGADQHGAAPKGTAPARLSIEESLFKNGIFGVFKSLLSNCSSHIYDTAVELLYNFVSENVFESRIAADTVAEMIFCAVRTNTKKTFPRFFNFVLDRLKEHITEETWQEDEVDDTITWYLVLATQLVRCDGSVLMVYKEKIRELLRLIIPLKSKVAYEICGVTIQHLFMALSFIYMTNHEKKRLELDQPLDQYLPVRHWAEPCKRKELKIEWHVPSEKELEFLSEVFEEFLHPVLRKLQAPEDLSNEAILKCLYLVKTFVEGAGTVLPVIKGKLKSLVQSEVDMKPFTYSIAPDEVKGLKWKDGTEIRLSVIDTLHGLTDYMLKHREDDTKSLKALSSVFNTVIFQRGMYRSKYDAQVKGFNMSKKIVGDVIKGKNSSVENVVTEIVLIQHHKRLLEKSGYYFTDVHVAVMKDVFRLATSMYSAVRKEAQAVLEIYCYSFPYCYNFILDDVLALLKEDKNITHEQLKGALYILYNGKKKALCVRQTWTALRKIWPAIVRAQHSEKPSIIKLLEDVQNLIVDSIESFQIRFEMSKKCMNVAKEVWDLPTLNADFTSFELEPKPDLEALEAKSAEREKEKNDGNERIYNELMEELVVLSTDTSLHWRHLDLAQSLLSLMIRKDADVSVGAVSVFLKLLTHDSLKTRKMTIGFIGSLLKIARPKAKKKELKVNNTAGVAQPLKSAGDSSVSFPEGSTRWPITWGVNQSNARFLYRKEKLPKSEEDWNKMEFLEKTHWGLYVWPKKHLVYESPDKQDWNREISQLKENDKLVLETFLDETFVDKLSGLLSVEEKKGDDSFQAINYCLFKELFRNFGTKPLKTFKPLLERLMKSDKEGEQRLATEIVTGLLQGCKLWSFTALNEMWSWLGALLVQTFENMTSETYKNWGTCVATVLDSRDPRRNHWLLEILWDLASRPMDSSFHTAHRFFLFQGAINSQEWRVCELWHRLLSCAKPMISQPYQNLRDRLGSCISSALWFDMPGFKVDPSLEPVSAYRPPSLRDFLGEMERKLEIVMTECFSGGPQSDDRSLGGSRCSSAASLTQIQPGNGNSAASSVTKSMDAVLTGNTKAVLAKTTELLKVPNGAVVSNLTHENPERKESILVLKTILGFMNAYWGRAYVNLPQQILDLLPLLLYYENETSDDELKQTAHIQLFLGMAKAQIFKKQANDVLDLCERLSDRTQWWKSKVSLLLYLQVQVFSNLFMYSESSLKERVRGLVDKLLRNEKLEVREAGAQTLSGFFQCGFFGVSDGLIKSYVTSGNCKEGIERHSGVLALGAVIQASPYSVPKYLPDVLMHMCLHGSDPQPIQGTVKKVLSEFKRTHHDSWHEHKEEFTDDQLVVLTDLLVSPNYYV